MFSEEIRQLRKNIDEKLINDIEALPDIIKCLFLAIDELDKRIEKIENIN